MPCRSDGYPEPTTAEIRETYEREFEHNSRLAQLLCSVIKTAHQNGIGNTPFYDHILRYMPDEDVPYLKAWWKEHEKRDKAKALNEAKQKEYLKQHALAKLTNEERKALGL